MIDERIADLAERQHGVVTRPQLLAAGITAGRVESRLSSGALRRLHAGVYILGHLRGSLEPDRAHEMAAVLACGPGVLISHRSGARLLGIGPRAPRSGDPAREHAARGRDTARPVRPVRPALPTPATLIDVSYPEGRTPTSRAGIRAHRAGKLEPGDIAEVQGIPLTSAARTILDLAAISGSRELEQAVARAERLGLVDDDALNRLVARSRGRRGARLLRAVVQRDGGALLLRSEAESRLLEIIRSAGLPAPEVNVIVGGFELDFLFRKYGIAVEVDGFAYHRSRTRFEGDRDRDAELFALGIRTMRVTWDQLVNRRDVVLARLAMALGRAGAGGHGL